MDRNRGLMENNSWTLYKDKDVNYNLGYVSYS